MAHVFLEKLDVIGSFPEPLCTALGNPLSLLRTFALLFSLAVLGSAVSPSCFLLLTKSNSSLVSVSQRLPCQALFHKHFHESSALSS